MAHDRSAIINIGGDDYELLLTTRATKQIAQRYGGLEQIGEKLMNAENFELALDEIIWLLTVLANQPIMIYNLRHNDNLKPLLTEETLELLTSPLDLAEYKDAISLCMYKGTARNVESEQTESKNATAG